MHLVVHPGYLLVVPIGTGVTRLSPLRPEFTKLGNFDFLPHKDRTTANISINENDLFQSYNLISYICVVRISASSF